MRFTRLFPSRMKWATTRALYLVCGIAAVVCKGGDRLILLTLDGGRKNSFVLACDFCCRFVVASIILDAARMERDSFC